MPTTSPARIDDDLYASARLAGEVQSRSTSQQVVHWARIGREIEASAAISQREIAQVLAGSQSYDGLNAREQALVRAEWSVRMDELRGALNFAQEFAVEGTRWVELDDEGVVVERSSEPARSRKAAGMSGKAAGTSGKAAGTKGKKGKAAAPKARPRSVA